MATIFPNNVVLSPAVGTPSAPGPYIGWAVSTDKSGSTGPRIYALTIDPNGTLIAPLGSIALLVAGGFKTNTNGGTTWANVP